MLRRCIVLALLGLCGCHDVDQITQYKAPKEAAPKASRPNTSATPAAWFLKLTGPAEKVSEQYEAFFRLMSRFHLDASGKPNWEAPEGWAEVPPKDLDPTVANMRYATLRLKDSEPPLDITITTLPSPDPTTERSVQMNVNRWRRQLQLEPLEGEGWLEKAEETKEIARFGSEGAIVTFTNIKGKSEDGSPAQTLAAIFPYLPPGFAAADQSPPTPPMPPSPPAGSDLKYKAPEDWMETRKPLASVAFTRSEGDQSFDVTVIRLGGGGALLPNVNRWRGQIGLDPIQEDALKTTPVPVGELTGQLIDLQNGDKALMTVVIPQGDAQWFVKLMGSNELAQKERDKFLEFAKSIRFE